MYTHILSNHSKNLKNDKIIIFKLDILEISKSDINEVHGFENLNHTKNDFLATQREPSQLTAAN